MLKKLTIVLCILIGCGVLITGSCGYWVMAYDLDPRVTVTFNTENAVMLDIVASLESYSKEQGYYDTFAANLQTDGFIYSGVSLKYSVSGTFTTQERSDLVFYTSKLSYLRPTDDEIMSIAKQASIEIAKVEGVSVKKIELFQPKR